MTNKTYQSKAKNILLIILITLTAISFLSLVIIAVYTEHSRIAGEVKKKVEYEAAKAQVAKMMNQRFERIEFAIESGRRNALVRISFENDAKKAFLIKNDSSHHLSSVEVCIADVKRWDKILDERTHGIRFEDMPSNFRTDWLNKMHYWDTWQKLFEETHHYLEFELDLPPHESVMIPVKLPALLENVEELTLTAESVTDLEQFTWAKIQEESEYENSSREAYE